MSHARRTKIRNAEMAIDRLRSGTERFQQWRKGNSFRYLDLSGADLAGLRLSGVDLRNTRLKGANLSDCDLSGAILAGANLNNALLVRTDLRGANLHQTRLGSADLSGARMDGANLYGAVRENWTISGVACSFCWIRKDRHRNPEHPDRFEPLEFETVFGGSRFKVKFPGGLQPIDLVALPFYANVILERFPDQKLVFVGMTTVPEPALEFRVEALDERLQTRAQEAFEASAPDLRALIGQALAGLSEQAATTRIQASVIQGLLAHSSTVLGRPQPAADPNTPPPRSSISIGTLNLTATGAVSVGGDLTAGEITQDNRESGVDLAELAEALLMLRQQMVLQSSTPDHFNSVAEVTAAEHAARNQDSRGMIAHLQKAGAWAMDVSTRIGVGLATEALKKASGLT